MALQDMHIFLLSAFVFVIMLVSFGYVYDQVTGEMKAAFAQSGGDATQANKLMDEVGGVFNYLDYFLLFSYIVFLVGSLILSFMVRTHPMFYMLFMIGALVMVFISYIYGNVLFEYINSNEGFANFLNNYPKTVWFIQNLHYIILVTSVVIAVVQYSKIEVF